MPTSPGYCLDLCLDPIHVGGPLRTTLLTQSNSNVKTTMTAVDIRHLCENVRSDGTTPPGPIGLAIAFDPLFQTVISRGIAGSCWASAIVV
jgi:hypothetical protein